MTDAAGSAGAAAVVGIVTGYLLGHQVAYAAATRMAARWAARRLSAAATAWHNEAGPTGEVITLLAREVPEIIREGRRYPPTPIKGLDG